MPKVKPTAAKIDATKRWVNVLAPRDLIRKIRQLAIGRDTTLNAILLGYIEQGAKEDLHRDQAETAH